MSHDGSILYGIDTHSGKLYSFDAQTGQKKYLSTVGTSSEIVDDFEDKLYIQGRLP